MNNSMPWAYPSTGVVAPEATIDIGGGGIVATLLGWFMSYICLFDWLIWLIILMWLVEWLIAWSIDLILLILRIVIWSIDLMDMINLLIGWFIEQSVDFTDVIWRQRLTCFLGWFERTISYLNNDRLIWLTWFDGYQVWLPGERKITTAASAL